MSSSRIAAAIASLPQILFDGALGNGRSIALAAASTGFSDGISIAFLPRDAASVPDYAHSAESGKIGRGRLRRLAKISTAARSLPPDAQDDIALLCVRHPRSSCRSALSHELVDAALLGQSGVDVAMRVDAHAVDMAALHAGEHCSLSIADAHIGGLAVVFLLGDVIIAVLAAGDVVRAPHARPLAEEVSLGREDLDAL